MGMLRKYLALILSACTVAAAGGAQNAKAIKEEEEMHMNRSVNGPYTAASPIRAVMNDPVFGEYGRLLLPADEDYWSGETLRDLRLTWYNYVNADKTVEIVNTLYQQARSGGPVFFDIYTDAEKRADPAKKDTGLFFFRGSAGAKFAICNAGGGFAFVGAMHDSFPHALQLSKKGYNAFALIY